METNLKEKQLELCVLDKTYPTNDGQRLPVLRNIHIQLDRGEFCCLLGNSGCGKTTLLNIISGLDKTFLGKRELSPPNLKIAYVFQEPCLLPWKTVRKNLEFVVGAKKPEKISEILEEFGIEKFANAYPGELSLGMARRVSIARALLYRADIVLLDEPFVSLDQTLSRSLQKLIGDLWEKYRLTFMLVTHDVRQALELGTRFFLMSGSPAEIRKEVRLNDPLETRNEQWLEQQAKKLHLQL